MTPHDAKGMMLTAIRDPDPVIFLEAGALYGTKGEVPEGEFTVPFGRAHRPRDPDVTPWSATGGRSTCCCGWRTVSPKRTSRSRPR